jgi:hypothetical protein
VRLLALLTTAWLAQAPALAQPPQPAPSADPPPLNLPVSLDRIKIALQRPSGRLLRTLDQKPMFRVEILERQRFDALLASPYFKPGPVPPGGLYVFEQMQRLAPGWTPPMGGVDLLAIGRAIGSGISSARRSHAEEAAREEVRKALEDFWAAQGKTPPPPTIPKP